jgi:hypothetical protein
MNAISLAMLKAMAVIVTLAILALILAACTAFWAFMELCRLIGAARRRLSREHRRGARG